MTMYSVEDKSFIEQFVLANSLDVFSKESEPQWQELGSLMNRDWEDIRKMYQNWKIQNNPSESVKEENNDNSQDQNLDVLIEDFFSSTGPNTCDLIEFQVNTEGQLMKTNHLQYAVDAPLESLASQIDSAVQSSSEKRPRDVLEIETNTELVRIFQNQSLKELELKRKEHEEKMMIYRQELIYGAELHKERMKILKAKLRALEEKVESIDNVICNKNSKKKFKSGSI